MKSHIAIATVLVAAIAIGVHAEEQVDEAIVARIKMEAFQHSRIMETLTAVLVASPLSSGVITATDAGGFDLSGPNWKIPNPNLAPPSFVLAREHYGRIARLVDRKRPVTLEVQLDADITPTAKSVNIIAEMPGTDARLADQVVMLGGHLDSWNAGTGATDNGAGSS